VTRVREIVTFDGNLEYAFAPQSITLCLDNELDISRGDMLVHPRNMPRAERHAEAMLVWMSATPFAPNKPYSIKHLTSSLRATFPHLQYRIDPNTLHRENASTLGLNEIGRVTVEFYRPAMFDPYSRNRQTGSFIVMDPMTHETVGAAMIIDRVTARPADAADVTSKNIRAEQSLVTAADRRRLLRQGAATIWLTGLSGSGKSTIARNLEKRLTDAGQLCYVLDGDNIRHGLNRDLGFDPRERAENIRRIAEVARLMNDAGLIVITSFISPYREDRDRAREIIGAGHFLETYLDTPVEVCEQRDTKGLYQKARAGEIEGFTGVSAPYEAPESPVLRIPTHECSVADAVEKIWMLLLEKNIVESRG
jgi:bifunctional enzyme CysN/CysC